MRFKRIKRCKKDNAMFVVYEYMCKYNKYVYITHKYIDRENERGRNTTYDTIYETTYDAIKYDKINKI